MTSTFADRLCNRPLLATRTISAPSPHGTKVVHGFLLEHDGVNALIRARRVEDYWVPLAKVVYR